VDLFKIAHHGSHNGTPYDLEGNVRILEKIVSPNRTNVVVSTVTGAHGKTNKVPYPPLMAELGRLAANSRCYLNGESELADAPQPQRTDRESDSTLPGVDFIEIPVPPAQPLDEQ
jgi:hypothetical protein